MLGLERCKTIIGIAPICGLGSIGTAREPIKNVISRQGHYTLRLVAAPSGTDCLWRWRWGGGGGGGGGTAGTISIATHALAFHLDSLSQSTPPPQSISATVTGVTAPTLYLVIRVTGPAVGSVSDFTITGTTSGQAMVYPQGQLALGAGTFSSTITVIACTTDPSCSSTQLNGSPITIDVTYTINGLNSSATNLGYIIGNAPTSADLTGTFNVTGYPIQSFTTTTNVPWLSVTPTSASTSVSTAIAGKLVPAELDKLDSGQYTANVTMTPTSGDPVVVPVTLNVTRTQVNYASPYADLSGAQGDVIIRGENFNLVHPTAIQFGSTAATSFTVLSDTEIHAAHPPLAAGTYTVHVVNTEGIDRTRAQLVVADAQAHAAAALAYPSAGPQYPLDLVYDAGRGALLVALVHPNQGVSSTELDRYSYVTGTSSWSSASSTPLPGIGAMGLTADGGKLLVGTQDPTSSFDSDVNELDPTSLVTQLTTSVMNFGPPEHIAVVNDGRAILTGGSNALQPIMSYTELRPQVVPLDPHVNGPTYVYNGVVAASGDGSTATITDGLEGAIMQWNASTEQLSVAQSSNVFYWASLSRDGSRKLVGGSGGATQVFDANLNPIGTLPSTTLIGVVAPSGLRAYTYDLNGTVRVFDLTTPPGSQAMFPEILPAITPSASPSTNQSNPLKMVITPDGGTVFIAGDRQVIVLPVP